MGKNMSSLQFRLMAFGFKFRDFFLPRKKILEELDLKPGFHVLDYGCGPGGYIVPLSGIVGKTGKVYALDASQYALKSIKNLVIKHHLTNVEAIHSDSRTGLPDNSLDVILLYDVLHDLNHPDNILKELHRVLKPHGTLSISDHHLDEEKIMALLTGKGYFILAGKKKRTYSFSRKRQAD
jgi:ubiquinone/menaquinone biosynthesis C-methylase UbiE